MRPLRAILEELDRLEDLELDERVLRILALARRIRGEAEELEDVTQRYRLEIRRQLAAEARGAGCVQ